MASMENPADHRLLLEDLYLRLGELTAAVPVDQAGNFCGSCSSCCTYPIHLKVSALELALLEVREKAFKKEAFLQFINRPQGRQSKKVCPHYSNESHGCSVYPSRPLCCRVFGYVPFRKMAKNCAYHSVDLRALNYRQMEKLFSAFSALRLSYYRDHRAAVELLSLMDYLIMGNVLIEEGKIEEAFRLFDRALALDPESSLSHSYQAKKYEMTGELHKAEASYRKALEYDHEEPTLYVKLGFVLYGRGDYDGALALYDEAERRDPGCFMAYGNQGLALLAQGKYEEAFLAYTRASELEPENVTFHLMKGNILEMGGFDQEATDEFHAALKLDGTDSLVHLCLAKLFKKKGDTQKAISHFETFRDLSDNPRFRDQAQAEIEALRKGI